MGARIIKPALYRMEGFQSFIETWHWVRLGDLAGVVGLRVHDILDRFEALVRPIRELDTIGRRMYSLPNLHWVIRGAVQWTACCGGVHHPWQEAPGAFEDLFVPAGWAQDVIEVCRRGVYRVRRQTCDFHGAHPEGALLVFKNPDSHGVEDDRIAVVGLDASWRVVKKSDERGRMLLR